MTKQLKSCQFIQKPEAGSRTIVYAAISPYLEGKGGTYLSNCYYDRSHKKTKDERETKKLFDLTCDLLKIQKFVDEVWKAFVSFSTLESFVIYILPFSVNILICLIIFNPLPWRGVNKFTVNKEALRVRNELWVYFRPYLMIQLKWLLHCIPIDFIMRTRSEVYRFTR